MDKSVLIEKIVRRHDLGTLKDAPVEVSGGFLHEVYRVETDKAVYALKLLNPAIMQKPDAEANFASAEQIEARLEKEGFPVVAALVLDGKKRNEIEGRQYYVFPWRTGKALAWNAITPEHCRKIGALLGRLHSIEPETAAPFEKPAKYDWTRFSGAIPEIGESAELLKTAEAEYRAALEHLPAVKCVSHCDMDPKNVLWQDGEPEIIDLECLGCFDPYADAFGLALQWSGTVTCDLSGVKLTAFLRAYQTQRQIRFDWAGLYGLGFNWLDWLEFNARRAAGMTGEDGVMREMGREQVSMTLKIIAAYAERKDEILSVLKQIGR